MYAEILFGFCCFAVGLITGPLVLFSFFKLVMKLLKRKRPQ